MIDDTIIEGFEGFERFEGVEEFEGVSSASDT